MVGEQNLQIHLKLFAFSTLLFYIVPLLYLVLVVEGIGQKSANFEPRWLTPHTA